MSDNAKKISVLAHVAQGGAVFGRVRYAPGGRCGPRRQADWQLVVLETGGCILRVERRRMRIQPGQAVLLRPGLAEDFHFDPRRPTIHAWAAVEKLSGPLPAVDCCGIAGWVSPRLETLVTLGLAPGSGNSDSDLVRMRALAEAAIREFLDSGFSGAGTSARDSLVRARSWIEEHLATPFSLQELSRACGCSSSPLRARFVQAEGMPPMRYVRRRRMHRAARLIRGTGMKLAAVANACGMANEYHLSRLFKAEFGVAPGRWRREFACSEEKMRQ